MSDAIRECRECGEPKYLTPENFPLKDSKTGRMSMRCRDCYLYRRRNGLLAKRPVRWAPIKVCSHCGEEKPREEFYASKEREGAVSSYCKSCSVKKTMATHSARIRADWRVRMYRYAKANNFRRGSVHEKVDWEPEYMQELWELQRGRCHWTGVEMTTDMGTLYSVSLDRLENAIGYLKCNVVLTTRGANFARNTATMHDFAEFIRKIKEV